jgi:hypothetical protein
LQSVTFDNCEPDEPDDLVRSHYPNCDPSRRREYWGRMVQKCPGLRTDGTPYTEIVRRRCRCIDCGQVRIDKEYT